MVRVCRLIFGMASLTASKVIQRLGTLILWYWSATSVSMLVLVLVSLVLVGRVPTPFALLPLAVVVLVIFPLRLASLNRTLADQGRLISSLRREFDANVGHIEKLRSRHSLLLLSKQTSQQIEDLVVSERHRVEAELRSWKDQQS